MDEHHSVVLESEALHARVRAFIDESLRQPPVVGAQLEAGVAALALHVARFQATRVEPVARLWRARGVSLDAPGDVARLPGLPTDVFRLTRVAAHPPDLDGRVFRTSGTSRGACARGEHPMRSTATYAHAALGWGARLLWPAGVPPRTIVLAPTAEAAPDSSLSFMLDLFVRDWGARAIWGLTAGADGEASLDTAAIAAAAAEARRDGVPVMVLGTSFAFVHLSEARTGLDLRLPPGSAVMQTGGFKGRSREVSNAEMRALLAGLFAVDEGRICAEYGMTELSSQLYEGTLAGRSPPGSYQAPPWVRVDPVDPVSLEPLVRGEVGIARILDLANVDSALVIQTADRVRVTEHGIELLGRQPGAVPRGCSLAIDEVLGGGRGRD